MRLQMRGQDAPRWPCSLAAAAALAVIVVGALAPSTSDRPGDVPTRLDATLDRLPAGTRVFNAYALGGWIAWRHPDLEQYIDGLITPYSERHAHDYTIAEGTEPGWYRVSRRPEPGSPFLPTTLPSPPG